LFTSEPKVDLGALDPVWPGELGGGVAVVANAKLEVGPVVVDHLHPEGDHRAVAHHAQLQVIDAVGAVVVGAHHVVEPVLEELDRLAAGAGQGGGQHRHLVGEQLAAKATAGDRWDQVQLTCRDVERDCDQPADIVVHRGVGMDSELAGALVILRDRADGLHRLRAGARPARLAPHDQLCAGHVLGVAAEGQGALQSDVVRPTLGVKHRVSAGGQRILGVDHGGQQLILDLNQVERILSDVTALGHHCGHRLADMSHLLVGDAVLGRGRAREAGQRARLRGSLGPGHHEQHAGQRPGLAYVNADDSRVGVRAAQHGGVGHIRHRHIVDIFAAPREQPRILDPLHILADPAHVGRVGLDGWCALHCAPPCMASAALSTASTIVW
jgi:hypothetical protein